MGFRVGLRADSIRCHRGGKVVRGRGMLPVVVQDDLYGSSP